MGARAPAINLQFGQMSLFNQDVICRDVLSTGEKSQSHPPRTASAFGGWRVGRNLCLFNNHCRTARHSPASKPAAAEPTATEPMAAKSAAGPELMSKPGSMKLGRREAEVAASRRPAEVGPRHAHRPLTIANLRERFRRPTVDAA